MKVDALLLAVKVSAAPALYRGKTIQRGRAGRSIASMLDTGGFTRTIVPFVDPSVGAPITASGAKRRITSIDSFLRLIGRASGRMSPASGRTRASSSVRRRQPRKLSPAQSVLLPLPGGAGS